MAPISTSPTFTLVRYMTDEAKCNPKKILSVARPTTTPTSHM